MANPGFVVANFNELRALPAANRRPDLPILVGSEDAWYIFKDGSTAAENLPTIVEPDDSDGRWKRAQATDANPGSGPGGGSNIPVYAIAPNTAPSGNGDARAQDTITTSNITLISYTDNLPRTIDYTIQRQALWIAEGSTIASWKRFGTAPTTLEFTNIVGVSNSPANLQWSEFNPAEYFRFDLGLHPAFIGEKLIAFYRTASGSSRSETFTAVPVAAHYWVFSTTGGLPPTISPDLQWFPEGIQSSFDPTFGSN